LAQQPRGDHEKPIAHHLDIRLVNATTAGGSEAIGRPLSQGRSHERQHIGDVVEHDDLQHDGEHHDGVAEWSAETQLTGSNGDDARDVAQRQKTRCSEEEPDVVHPGSPPALRSGTESTHCHDRDGCAERDDRGWCVRRDLGRREFADDDGDHNKEPDQEPRIEVGGTGANDDEYPDESHNDAEHPVPADPFAKESGGDERHGDRDDRKHGRESGQWRIRKGRQIEDCADGLHGNSEEQRTRHVIAHVVEKTSSHDRGGKNQHDEDAANEDCLEQRYVLDG